MLPTKGPDSYGYGNYTYGVTHDFDEVFDTTDTHERTRSRRAS